MVKNLFYSWGIFLIAALLGSPFINPSAQVRQVVFPTRDYSYLTNPGIGWQHSPGIGEQLLPESVAYFRRSTISWSILNPAEGVFDWKVLDQQIGENVALGEQVSFRVYTMRGESFGGHQVPDWAMDKGAAILDIGDPDYNNCTYQEEWGIFVEALRERYDGNPDIAFIDISGYGNFNEWSWLDDVTEWDYLWEEHYEEGTASPKTIETLDGQSRRRLADMFIGGEFEDHECINADGEIETVDYEYPGFSSTQLVMPYAGVRQSNQYVVTQRADVGFRHDCLGRESSLDLRSDRFSDILSNLWQQAPVIYEFCGYGLDDEYLDRADVLLAATHASVVHDNIDDDDYRDAQRLEEIMQNVGYRYVLRRANLPVQSSPGEELFITMDWANVGYAPSYPAMGQKFALFIELQSDETDDTVRFEIDADISKWMPSDGAPEAEPGFNYIIETIVLPDDLPPGTYQVKVSIINLRTETPILLAIYGRDSQGWYSLGEITIDE